MSHWSEDLFLIFFGDQLKDLTKTAWRPFLTGLQFSFLDLVDCPGFLCKKYSKSNYNIHENCHYLYSKIVIMLCSAVIFLFIFFNSTTWQPALLDFPLLAIEKSPIFWAHADSPKPEREHCSCAFRSSVPGWYSFKTSNLFDLKII